MKLAPLALLALTPLAPLAAREPEPHTITKTEIRTAPPEQTHRRLRDLTWEMFEQEDLRSSRRPRRALHDVVMATRPRATEVPGLCRYDAAAIEFAPLRRGRRHADTPVRAVGLTATSFFHFLRPPAAAYDEAADYERLPEADGCPSLEADALTFFTAPDAEVATEGYRALLGLQRALADRRPVPLACDLFPNETRSCEAIVTALREDQLDGVERCETPDPHELCYIALAGDRDVTVWLTSSVPAGPPAGQIVRGRLRSLISFSDRMID